MAKRSEGRVFKRCGCTDPATRKRLGAACPKLTRRNGSWSPTHGTWSIQLELPPPPGGGRRYLRRSGFATQRAAAEHLNAVHALLALADTNPAAAARIAEAILTAQREGAPLPTPEQARALTHRSTTSRDPSLAQWLEQWLQGRKSLQESSKLGYAKHIRLHLIPRIGHLRLGELTATHIQHLFDAIAADNDAITAARASTDAAVRATVQRRRPVGPYTQHCIRATLRAALTAAVKRPDIALEHNPARHVELPPAPAVKPLVWTQARVEQWRRSAHVPGPVMVWTPHQTGAFLDHARTHPLYALFHLTAHAGLRRGEACGLRWADLDLDAATATIAHQIICLGVSDGHGHTRTQAKGTKTAGSTRTLALTRTTTAVLRAHKAHQNAQRLAAGPHWADTGYVFTRADGTPYKPDALSHAFRTLITSAGLPPITFRCLRHGAATMHLAAGADIKTVQELLGHTTIKLTANTYTSVLPEIARQAAENAAALIPHHPEHPPTSTND